MKKNEGAPKLREDSCLYLYYSSWRDVTFHSGYIQGLFRVEATVRYALFVRQQEGLIDSFIDSFIHQSPSTILRVVLVSRAAMQ